MRVHLFTLNAHTGLKKGKHAQMGIGRIDGDGLGPGGFFRR